MPPPTQPPPVIDCYAGPLNLLPPIPQLVEMDVWAIAVMGVYADAATKYMAENACLDALRAKGVIR